MSFTMIVDDNDRHDYVFFNYSLWAILFKMLLIFQINFLNLRFFLLACFYIFVAVFIYIWLKSCSYVLEYNWNTPM